MEEIEFGSWQPSLGAPSTTGEIFDSAYEAQRLGNNSLASIKHLVDYHNRRSDQIKAIGLPPPKGIEERIGEFNGLIANPADQDKARKLYELDLKTLAEKNPQHAGVIRADKTPWQQYNEDSAAAEGVSAAVAEKRGWSQMKTPIIGPIASTTYNLATDPVGFGAQMAGSMRAQAENPIEVGAFIGSWMFPSAARTGLKGIAKAAGQQVLANMATQAALEPGIQLQRKQLGLEYGLNMAIDDIIGSGIAGGLMDAGVRGVYRGVKKVQGKVPKLDDAGYVTGYHTGEPELPQKPQERPEITPELVKRVEDGDLAAARELAEKTGAINDPAVKGILDYADLGGKVDEDTIKFFRENGIDTGEGLKTLANVMRHPDMYFRVPEAVRAADAPLIREEAGRLMAEHGERVREAIAALPEDMRGRVQDLVEAGIPKVVEAVKAALEAKDPAAVTAKINDFVEGMGGADKVADLATIHGMRGGPVRIAEAMRRSPEFVDSNVSLEMDLMKGARAIAALDDAAFARVQAGEVHPAVAAVVADMVPPGMHGRVIDDLLKAGVQSARDAIEIIPDLVPRAKAEMPLNAGAKIDDPAGPAAKAQTKLLEAELAPEIEEAMRPILAKDAADEAIFKGTQEAKALEVAQDAEVSAQPPQMPRYADPITGADLRPDEVESIVDMWRYVNEMRREKRPQTLSDWVMASGRIQDQGGEISAILDRARYMISGSGRTLDDIALNAWEAGFLPGMERPDINRFIDALRDDVSGARVYRESDAARVEDFAVAEQMREDLGRLGVDNARTEDDVRAYFAREGEARARGSEATAGAAAVDPTTAARISEVRAEISRLEQIDDNGLMFALADEPKTRGLDMSPEARKARAKELGFDTSRVFYHGTGSDIEAFSLRRAQDKEGRQRGLGLGKGKVYLTGHSESASAWAMQAPDRGLGDKPNVVPVYVKGRLIDESVWSDKFSELSGGKKPYASDLSMSERDAVIARVDAWAKEQGYSGIQQARRDYKTGEILEVGQVAVFDPKDIRSINADFDPAKTNSANLLYALSPEQRTRLEALRRELSELEYRANPQPSTEALAAKRAEIRASEVARIDAKAAVDGNPPDLLYRMILESAAVQRRIDVRRAIDDALRLANRILPEGTKVQIETGEIRDPVSGHLLDATSDTSTGDITLATYALNPSARLSHESLHTLVTRGHVSPEEIGLLATAARESGAFPEATEAKYREAYKDRPNLERLISEESAAHFVEARLTGTTPAHTIADRIRATIQRIRNALQGYGFRTAEDIRDAVLRGDMAKREAVQAWMRSEVPGQHFPKGTLFAIKTDEKTGKRYIEAYHGSPYDFDRASLEHVGKGEGAQVFGHGFYAAEDQGVGAGYKEKLSAKVHGIDGSGAGADAARFPFVNGHPVSRWSGMFDNYASAARYLEANGGDYAKTLAMLKEEQAWARSTYETAWHEKAPKDQLDTLFQSMREANGSAGFFETVVRRGDKIDLRNVEGRLYTLRIDADPDTFLDLDKPIAEQPPGLAEHLPEEVRARWDQKSERGFPKRPINQQEAEALSKAGVSGVRYLDGYSRKSGDGNRNYVVFDDGLVQITHKDGKPIGLGDALFAIRADRDTGRSMRSDLDALGFYSGALRAAKALRQAKGTPEQMLAMLSKEGAKKGEIEATGLLNFLEGKPSVTKDEIVNHLTQNRVGLNEVGRAKQASPDELDARARSRGFSDMAEMRVAFRRSPRDPAHDLADDTKWSSYSLDPSNPTYRETVLHLPPDERAGKAAWERDYPGMPWESLSDADRQYLTRKHVQEFQSGHFPEPNITGHLMTSMTKHEGRPVYTIDQIQSDWGQKLRDGGVRDEAKIAELKRKLDEHDAQHPEAARYMKMSNEEARKLSKQDEKRIQDSAPQEWWDRRTMLEAEIRTAEASTPGHPLVNTTDQWTNTTLRRALRQAVEANADYIAIPHGDTVVSYNPPGSEGPGGMRGFYGTRTSEGIVPKNLRKLIEKIDKDAAKPVKIEKLETSQGVEGWQGEGDYGNNSPKNGADHAQTGFTLFPLTDKVKASVKEEGQALFAIRDDKTMPEGIDMRLDTPPVPPRTPLQMEVGIIDRIGKLADLAMACRG